MIIIILVVLILLCGMGPFAFPSQPGLRYGSGGLGLILLILLILLVLGFVKV